MKKTTKFRVDKKHSGSLLGRVVSEFEERHPDLLGQIRILNNNELHFGKSVDVIEMIEFAGLLVDGSISNKQKDESIWTALNSLKDAMDNLKKYSGK